MPNDLNLRVPGKNGRGDRPGRPAMIMIAAAVALLVVFVAFLGFGDKRGSRFESSGLSAKKLEALALKFENQKLPEAAARAWTEYLGAAKLGDEAAARIWFRVGKLHQDSHEYGPALEAYYRSEAIARVEEIEQEISTRTVERLEAMSKFTAPPEALADRTAIPGMGDAGGAKGSQTTLPGGLVYAFGGGLF